MDNECLYLCSKASTLSMKALKCTAHLLPLIRLLRFIINVCNKFVTLALIVINRNDDFKFFFLLTTNQISIQTQSYSFTKECNTLLLYNSNLVKLGPLT